MSRGKKYTESVLKIVTVIGVSLSEPHTSGKLGMDVTYANNYEIVRAISYLVGKIIHVMKENKHTLLMLLI